MSCLMGQKQEINHNKTHNDTWTYHLIIKLWQKSVLSCKSWIWVMLTKKIILRIVLVLGVAVTNGGDDDDATKLQTKHDSRNVTQFI